MKRISILYWIITILFGGFMTFSGIPDILMVKEARDFIGQLGYPLYFIPFIGVAKVLGGIAILVPGFPRLKEWAYAGLMFDIIAAMYSVACVSGVSAALPISLFLVLGFASYFLYHKRKRMQGTVI
jgi:uncharacterized membrane protein YphA (DoxX/SURF4 family)